MDRIVHMGNKSITPCNSSLSSPGRYNLSLSTVQYKCKVKWTAYSLETPFSKKTKQNQKLVLYVISQSFIFQKCVLNFL